MLPRILPMALVVLVCACGPGAERLPLDDLVLRDSTYLAPVTLEPYTGRVFRLFEDEPDRLQLDE